MSQEIRLYWWTKNGAVNLGDEMNRFVVEHVSGKRVVQADIADADLLAIGSVLHFPQMQKALKTRTSPWLVWGSGSLYNDVIRNQPLFQASALRGPLTASLIRNGATLPFGDPGIFAREIWPQTGGKQHRWGLIPHHSQRGQPWVRQILEQTSGAVLIDVTTPDVGAVMARIAGCEFIASTSLHGLVIADSYEIPNVWLWDGALHPGGEWKFWDYFTGIGRHCRGSTPVGQLSDLTVLEKTVGKARHFAGLPARMQALRQAFPI